MAALAWRHEKKNLRHLSHKVKSVGLRQRRMLISPLPLVFTSTMRLEGRTLLNGKRMIDGAGHREKATSWNFIKRSSLQGPPQLKWPVIRIPNFLLHRIAKLQREPLLSSKFPFLQRVATKWRFNCISSLTKNCTIPLTLHRRHNRKARTTLTTKKKHMTAK